MDSARGIDMNDKYKTKIGYSKTGRAQASHLRRRDSRYDNGEGRFDSYLSKFRRRYKLRIIATAIAAVLFSILFLSLLTVILKDTLGDSNWLYYPARALLLILPVVILFAVLWKPYQRFKKSEGADELEQAVPAFDGRVDTYLDLKRRNVKSPFVGLLAKDAAKTAARAPVKSILPFGDAIGPAVASVGMVVLAGWLFTAMPLDWRASMKQLWMGWFVTDILPERSIAVTPGNTKIRIGDSLVVNAVTEGFDSGLAELHVRTINAQSDDWETVAMNPQEDGSFGFTLYGLSDPVEYYVSAAFTESERSSVEVVVPAKVISITHNYVYPDWTSLEPTSADNATDIYVVAGTQAEIIFETDKPLEQAIVLHDGEELPAAELSELRYSATLTVAEEGTYRLLDGQQNDRIPLSPEYRIAIAEDELPTVSFSQPGGDWSATPIEEVTVAVTADDDFSVESVILHYSVNGAPEEQIELNSDNNFEHLFMLEEFSSEYGQPLIAGDLVSYYAEAKDREQSVTTDMLFIDIRPFERRFTQSQQAGGGGGGGGSGQQEQEISQRQKEILVSTFNLIRDIKKSEAQNGETALIDPQDTATLLSDLQNTLADQAIKLAERADARQLLNNDPDIARFVEYIEEAEVSMRPSAESLALLTLDDAVKHQQRALQYLKRAESIFNDITINRNNENGGGGGGASQDMAEMYELEMDLAKNQYETPDSVPEEEAGQQAADDAFDKLKELARRQQKLAEAAAQKEQLSEADRWQQEKLRRELEELQRELERQQASNQQQGQQGQQGEQQSEQNSGESQGGQSSTSSEQRQQAMQNLEEAIEELRNAEQNRAELTPEERQQAMQSASDRLRQSLEQTADQRQQELQQQITDAADALRELNQEQQQTSDRLREAMRQAMEARKENRFESGLTRDEERQLAEQKRQLQRDLEDIRQQIDDASNRFADQAPLTTERLEQALNQLDQNQTSELLGISGDMIEDGLAPQAALREERINEALRNLQTDLFESSSLAAAETGTGEEQQATAADATRTLQQLRQALNEALAQAGESGESLQTAELQQLDRGAQSGEQGQEGQGQEGQDGQGQDGQNEQGQGQGQQGQEGQGQQGQQGQGQQGQGQSNQGQTGGTQPGDATTWGPNYGATLDREIPINNGQEQLIEESITQLQQFGGVGELSEQSIQDLSDLARQLQAGNNDENARIIEADVRLLLRQLEQLELQIYNETKTAQITRSKQKVEDPKGFDQQAADYFRSLSEQAGS